MLNKSKVPTATRAGSASLLSKPRSACDPVALAGGSLDSFTIQITEVGAEVLGVQISVEVNRLRTFGCEGADLLQREFSCIGNCVGNLWLWSQGTFLWN